MTVTIELTPETKERLDEYKDGIEAEAYCSAQGGGPQPELPFSNDRVIRSLLDSVKFYEALERGELV